MLDFAAFKWYNGGMDKINTKIAIIGGGASGLAAAALLSRVGISIVLLEQNPRVGKKLIATGNGRCNLGNCVIEPDKYHGNIELATKIFTGWKGSRVFFRQFGMLCRDGDEEGRLYPYSNTANTVLDVLRAACEGKVEVLNDTVCTAITPREEGGFIVNAQQEFRCGEGIATSGDPVIVYADNVIWACGGLQKKASGRPLAPGFAESGVLKKLGHTLTPPFPSLCPIITDKNLTRPLQNLRVRARCTAMHQDQVLKTEEGEVQFGDGQLSGICIMNLSRLVRSYGTKLVISLDIAPDYELEQLKDLPMIGLFHSRIASIMEKQPLETIKDWRFPVKGVADLKTAQVLSGGVVGTELNDDLSSKLHPGLYIVGESVDVDGDCGGYNLEWAWASATAAVRSVAGKVAGGANG